MEELISFLISAFNLFIICFIIGYFASDMISKMLAKRKASVAESIDDARVSKESAKETHTMYAKRIAGFSEERAAILERAKEKASKREAQLIQDAQAESDRIIARAEKEAQLKAAKVRDELKKDMITYAHATAMKLIAENMDEKKQAQFIEDTLNEMGESTWQS